MRAEPSILHVDLDAFYASVEQLHDPALRGRPVIVGGLGPRGVVAAASYEARTFGIGSAMPMVRARRLCPDGVFVAPRMDAYAEASRAVMTILRDVTPLVEPIALDEAFLDITGTRRRLGDPRLVGDRIRAEVVTRIGLVASVGAATTKLVAKLASDAAKPNGMLVVEPADALSFLHALPVERLWGVGPATRSRLARFSVQTVGDLAALPEDTVVGALGASNGHHLHALAWNRDERAVVPHREPKSIGHEETFPQDVFDVAVLRREVVRLSDSVGSRLRAAGLAGRTVQLKIRFPSFKTITRSRTLPEPTDVGAVVAQAAADLLAGVDCSGGIRLIGISVQQLGAGVGVAQSLFAHEAEGAGDGARATARGPRSGADAARQGAAERAADVARARFGAGAVTRAVLAPGEPDGHRGAPSR